MNPIQKLKGWVTLGEAAAHIAEKAGARVTEADILELAAQGELRLSARFCGSGTKGTVAGAYTDPEPDSYYLGRVEYVSAPLLFELIGVFDLIAKAPTDCGDLIGVVRVNEAGEIESLIGGLEVETDTQGRLLRLPCNKLPPTAQWVMRPDAVLEFCGKLVGEDREIEALRRTAEHDRSAKEAAILRAEQAEAEAAELRRQLEQERAARQTAEQRAEQAAAATPINESSPKSRNYYLRTIAALGHALIGGSTGKPYTDANAILAALDQNGAEAPIKSDALADYLEKAEGI